MEKRWLSKWPILLLGLLIVLTGSIKGYAEEDDSLQRVLDRGTLIVGTSADNPPKEFIRMNNGKEEIVGFDIDVAKEIAKELGVELEITNMKFDGLIPSIQTNEFDMALAGFNPTPERREIVGFSNPYHTLPFVILTTKDKAEVFTSVDSLTGKEVAAQKGSTQETILNDYLGNAQPVALGKLPEVIAEINAGTVDAGVVGWLTAQNYLDVYPNLTIADVEIEVPEEKTAQVIAFPKESTALIERVNEIIADMEEKGMMEDLLDKNIELAKAGDSQDSQSMLKTYGPLFLKGALTTIGVAVVCVLFGTLLGILIALLRISSNKLLKALATFYIQVLRGTPALLQVFIFYFGLSMIISIPSVHVWGVNLARLIPGCIALSINSSAYVAEIIRSGINAVDKGQSEAYYSLGLNKWMTMREIILPQAIRNILPALGNEFISMIKETSLLSVIAVSELMFVADTVKAATYRTMESLFIAAIIYFCMTCVVSLLVARFEKKLARSSKS